MSIITTERLTKILSETQAVISECNARGVHRSVEVNARLFENVLMELLRHRAAMLQGADGNSPVIPDGLRLALSNAGIAAPESDEMLAATCEKYIQALVTWVRDRKPFRPAPVVPDGSTCKYCGGSGSFRWQQTYNWMPCPCKGCTELAVPQQENE